MITPFVICVFLSALMFVMSLAVAVIGGRGAFGLFLFGGMFMYASLMVSMFG